MGRYDKIQGRGSSSFAQPSEISYYNGSTWVSLGANDSDNTNDMYVFDGSNWVRKTLSKVVRQTSTSYNFETQSVTWPSGVWAGTGNDTYYAQGDYSCNVPEGYMAWNTPTSALVADRGTSYWWASSELNYPNVWRDFYWRRNVSHWVYSYTFRSANSTYWSGCPFKCDFYAGEKEVYIGTYEFSNPGGANINFETTAINYKPNGGIKSSCMSVYDGSGWKRGNYSMRMSAFQYKTGNVTSTPVYTTYWE